MGDSSAAATNPNLILAVSLLAGIVGQTLASHLRVPGIVVLLGLGVLLGPDILGVIDPNALGDSLTSVVGFAVAVILFEGGMNLDIARIRRAGSSIQRLITVGSLITWVGATITVRAVMQWSWSLSILFGSLVIVTGPTVVTPLLKRLRMKKRVATVLEAEGVLIDPIGAILAVVALEVVLEGWAAGAVMGALPGVALRLGVGGGFGAAAGWLMSKVLKVRGLVPEGLENVFTLSMVFAVFQIAEAGLPESGIAAVTVAGMVVRFLGTPVEKELLEFKEQLTVMLIGMLFVLLAADVRLDDVAALGVPGLITVGVLMVVVRPLSVGISTVRTGLTLKEQAFIAWIGPRGIVAAAIASLFSVELDHHGLPGGTELRALVFLVIAVTVVVSGLTGGMVARLLDLRRPSDNGWIVLGAHPLGRKVGRILQAYGEEVVVVDGNPLDCNAAQQEGFKVVHGNALKDTTLGRLELDTRKGILGLTRNEEVNYLFSDKTKHEGHRGQRYVALYDDTLGVTEEMVRHSGARVAFGVSVDVQRWSNRILARGYRVERRVYTPPSDGSNPEGSPHPKNCQCEGFSLPVVVSRHGAVRPVGSRTRFKPKDEVVFLVAEERYEDVDARLDGMGWRLLGAPADAPSEDRPALPWATA